MKIVTSNVPKELYRLTPIAINFFVEHYFTEKSKRDVEEVAIRFLSTGYDQASDTMAYCDFMPETPRCFDIVFNNTLYRDITYKNYLTTIFHELTHADQYLTGRLKCKNPRNSPPYFVWKNKRYYEDSDYWREPWEIEAYGTEACAYAKFVGLNPELGLKRFKSRYNGRHRIGSIDDKIDIMQGIK